MALRAVPDHPKFADLKHRLHLTKGATLGYLECIWHFTARFTPRGNTGKYQDSAIEGWAEWDGEAGALVAALVESGWLHAHAGFRLVVHDWSDHADEMVNTTLARNCETFWDGTVPKSGRLNQHERVKFKDWSDRISQESDSLIEVSAASPKPVPVPVPEPVPEPACAPRSLASPPRVETSAASAGIPRQAKRPIQFPENALAERGREWLAKYPNQVDVDAAMREWLSLVTTEQRADEHFEALGRYMASAKWRNAAGELDPGKIKSPLYFIRDGLYRDSPAPFRSRDGPDQQKRFLSNSERNDEAAKAQFQKLMAKKQERENVELSRNR